jgi:glutamine synthetase
MEALNELRKDEVLKEALGRHVYENFMKVKLKEWDEFRIHVTEWEIEKYMKYC